MTEAEMNIIVQMIIAKIRMYQDDRMYDKADEEENEKECDRWSNAYKEHMKQYDFIKSRFFDGIITGADIFNNYEELNTKLVDVCEELGYPLYHENEAVNEFFGDMIWDAKATGEI
ncbi:MAG: hypothetical protein IJ740_08295 [Ruminococcus sp.]|nr:hypothetical protein [Ruminococcus sp.]